MAPAEFSVAVGESVEPGKALCGSCEVQVECLEYAIEGGESLQGVWGGASDRERRKLRQVSA